LTQRGVAFKPELNHLSLEDWLAVNKAQFGVGLVPGFADKIVTQTGRRQARDREALRDTQDHFAQRCFADVQLELAVDRRSVSPR
jgi:hypothetical protein